MTMRKTSSESNAVLPPDLWAYRVREIEQAVADVVRCEVWLAVYRNNYHEAFAKADQEAVWEWQGVIKILIMKAEKGSATLKKSSLTLQLYHAY